MIRKLRDQKIIVHRFGDGMEYNSLLAIKRFRN